MHRRTFHFGRVNKQGHAVIELSACGYNHEHYPIILVPFLSCTYIFSICFYFYFYDTILIISAIFWILFV